MEVRAKAIAVFFAIAQCFGAIAPVIYGVNAEGQSLEDVATPLNAGRKGTTRAEGAGSPRAV